MKRKLMLCTMLLLLCSMLINSTFALNATSSQYETATIESGSLDAELYWSTCLDDDKWIHAGSNSEDNAIFSRNTVWEPGYTQVRYFKIDNVESTNFDYELKLEWEKDGDNDIDPSSYPINNEIDIYRLVSPTNSLKERKELLSMEYLGTLGSISDGLLAEGSVEGHKNEIVAIAFRMKESASDKLKGASSGNFSINLYAGNKPSSQP